MNAMSLFSDTRLVPVVTIERAEDAVPLAEALSRAGLQAIEITLRTDAALDAIRSVVKALPDMIVGAGSIRQISQIQNVADAGAAFTVSPGSTEKLLDEAQRLSMPLVPGAATATEAMRLYEAGYELIKFFPAEISGGAAAIKAISAPLPEVKFFPTGGITADNLSDYLSLDAVACVGGSWFVPADCMNVGDFEKIESLARDALRITLD